MAGGVLASLSGERVDGFAGDGVQRTLGGVEDVARLDALAGHDLCSQSHATSQVHPLTWPAHAQHPSQVQASSEPWGKQSQVAEGSLPFRFVLTSERVTALSDGVERQLDDAGTGS